MKLAVARVGYYFDMWFLKYTLVLSKTWKFLSEPLTNIAMCVSINLLIVTFTMSI